MVGEGLTTKEIAFALGISENTVDEHVKKAMAKLHAPNRMRAAAAYRAFGHGGADAAGVGDAVEQPAYPQPRGVGISPGDQFRVFDPPLPTAMQLRDGDQAPFDWATPIPTPHRQIDERALGRDASTLNIIVRILMIAVAIVVILIAAPALISGAETIAAWLRSTITVQP